MQTEIINGIQVRIYKEDKHELVLFECTKCGDQDSYFYGTDTCRDCSRECRCCGVVVHPNDPYIRVINSTTKILNKPNLRHICFKCFRDWKNGRKFQMLRAHKDGWLKKTRI